MQPCILSWLKNAAPSEGMFPTFSRRMSHLGASSSFPSAAVSAQNWLHRLQVGIGEVSEMQVTAIVPPNKKPHIRCRKTIPYMDTYGFRALDTPFGHLCAFEFLRYWTAEALEPPSRLDPKPRTEWTDAGQAQLAIHAPDSQALAGELPCDVVSQCCPCRSRRGDAVSMMRSLPS